MLSGFRSILIPFLEEYEIKLNSGQESRLSLLEKHLNDGSVSLSEGMTQLRRENLKGVKGFFKDSVYRDIEKKLGFRGIKEHQEPKEIRENNQEQGIKPETKIS
jgi:hypothetical protein